VVMGTTMNEYDSVFRFSEHPILSAALDLEVECSS